MIRVLLVDDHELFRSALRLRLEQEEGIVPVGEAGTVEQAVIRARALQPDVVLLDLLLPDRSGPEAIPDLLKVSPTTHVLVVSSQTQPTSVPQAIVAGARGYVPKRASYTELIEAIRRVAAGERYVDPSLGAQLVVPDEVPALGPLSRSATRTRRSARSSTSRCERSIRIAHTSCGNSGSGPAPSSCCSHLRTA
jgi:DNA-binding NarL/FixJ family response regulator